MAAALALALPAALGKVAAVLRLPQQKADKAIVALMAKPRRPRGDEDPAAGLLVRRRRASAKALRLLQARC